MQQTADVAATTTQVFLMEMDVDLVPVHGSSSFCSSAAVTVSDVLVPTVVATTAVSGLFFFCSSVVAVEAMDVDVAANF